MDSKLIFEFIKQQGFSIAILCSAIFWFNKKYDAQQEQINQLNQYIRTELKTAVDKNTEAFRDFKFILENKSNEKSN